MDGISDRSGKGAQDAPDLSEVLPVVCNTDDAKLFENMRICVERNYDIITEVAPHEEVALLVGGGPSLADTIEDIRGLKEQGAKIWALNGAGLYLKDQGIIADYLLILDAREHNAKFLKGLDPSTVAYIASQCSPLIFDAAEANGNKIVCWHPAMGGQSGVVENRKTFAIDGGSSVGIRAFHLLWVIGYRNLHLFGYDSSYRGDRNHAYEQQENAGERKIATDVGGRQFLSSPWMVRQVDDFQTLAPQFVSFGMSIGVHGDGLLPWAASRLDENTPEVTEMKVIYDFATHPASYDFLTWATIVKMEAWRRKIEKVTVYFLHGPDKGYRRDGLPVKVETKNLILENVILPAIDLYGFEHGGWVEREEADDSYFEFPYKMIDVLTLFQTGVPMPEIFAPDWAERIVQRAIGDSRPIVITLREAEHWPQRNSNLEAWAKFAEELRKEGEQVIVVRDTAKAYEEFEGFQVLPDASFTLSVRWALYQRAKCVIGVSNGPLVLPILTDVPYLCFKQLVEGYPPGRPEWWEQAVGIKSGEQFPWAKPWQKMAWRDDSLPELLLAWTEIREALEKKDAFTA